MPFDKGIAITQAKMALPDPADHVRTDELEVALSMALNDLSARLRSQAYLTSDTDTIAKGSRTHTIKGQYSDAKRIFALKLGGDSTQRVLEFEEPQQFLRDYDAPDASAGSPTRYTILGSSDGFATIKFNVPLESAETLTVYHFVEFSTNNIAQVRCASAVVAGTIAYFCGIATPAVYVYDPIEKANTIKRPSGEKYYAAFEKLAKLSKSADSFTPVAPKQFELAGQDKAIRNTMKNIQRGRS